MCGTNTVPEDAAEAPAPSNAMFLRATLSYPGNRPAVLLVRHATRGSEDLSCSCMDDRRTLLSIGRRAHSCIPRSECCPVAPESPVPCCCLENEIQICR